MAKSIKDAIETARRKAAGGQPRKPTDATSTSWEIVREAPGVVDAIKGSGSRRLSEAKRRREEMAAKVVVTYGHAVGHNRRKEGRVTREASHRLNRPDGGGEEHPAGPATPESANRSRVPPVQRVPASVPSTNAAVLAPAALTLSPGAIFLLEVGSERRVSLLRNVESAGSATQCHGRKTSDEREVAMGLDFGTSTVKVVIGDPALERAFAVPFYKVGGIPQYLLPSRVYQSSRSYSLESGTVVHRDLKLSLLANPHDLLLQERVTAFLALVIRRARGWLLSEHRDTYKRTSIVWKLAVGLPTAQHLETELSRCVRRVSLAAWKAAESTSEIAPELVRRVLRALEPGGMNADDIEVAVIPEIAAQIYGFVVSTSFDRKAPNIYLMADVGAGTVDSSLFHVKPGRHGRWDFEFFTTVVEPNGVSNLHRHRVNWWQEELTRVNAPRALLDLLTASKLPTDLQTPATESFLDYFAGIRVNLAPGSKSPDEVFFNLRVLAQVQGKSFWRAWKDGLLDKQALANIPFFMCGGGMRMKYYRTLERHLASIPGCTWLKAKRWIMGVPANLIAEGITSDGYDRLSVAYGLSRLEVGKVVKALPRPLLATPAVETWRDNYVDKDLC